MPIMKKKKQSNDKAKAKYLSKALVRLCEGKPRRAKYTHCTNLRFMQREFRDCIELQAAKLPI